MYTYKAIISKVIDGDTFEVDVDLGFGIWLKNKRIRLMGINTPEKFGVEKEYGELCKKYAERYIGKEITINSVKDPNLPKDISTDSFGRYLVYVTLPNDLSLLDIYNELGINKLHNTYSESNVLKLLDLKENLKWN